jgi:D-aminoacyl-tRNA deacylase
MVGLLQRVSHASVAVRGEVTARIDRGLLVLVGFERGDTKARADRLLDRLFSYRIFADTGGKMNHSVEDIDGGLLLVPNFTLVADTRKGTRASFTPASSPEEGERLFSYLVDTARQRYGRVQAGTFGADMQVTLTNDGPVTFWLRVD